VSTFLIGLLFEPVDGSIIFLRNIGISLSYKKLQPPPPKGTLKTRSVLELPVTDRRWSASPVICSNWQDLSSEEVLGPLSKRTGVTFCRSVRDSYVPPKSATPITEVDIHAAGKKKTSSSIRPLSLSGGLLTCHFPPPALPTPQSPRLRATVT
jgi:hypothetical protein